MSFTTGIRALGKSFIAAALLASVLGAPAAQASNIGNEGCSPGYWKKHTNNWDGYATTTPLSSLFSFPDSLNEFKDDTMLEALNYGGGPGVKGATEILMRASVAAYLNANHEGVGYPHRRDHDENDTPPLSPLKDTINSALASGNRDTMLNLAKQLDAANNLGCPLD